MKISTPSNLVEMVFLYYDNPQMLRMQINSWNSYAGYLKQPPTVILVDDGSPRTSAAEIVRETRCEIPIKVFRIKEDIPWNFTGARNLGCHQAKNWIYMSDIDTILTRQDARRLFEENLPDKACYYRPKRVWYYNRPIRRHLGNVNLLYHKDCYRQTGGYDEDYAGNYGRGDTDFMLRLGRVARLVEREDVLVRVVLPRFVPDACTTNRERDKARNIELYERKEAAGFVNPTNTLRFSWRRVM
jgi:hypothetical protein